MCSLIMTCVLVPLKENAWSKGCTWTIHVVDGPVFLAHVGQSLVPFF